MRQTFSSQDVRVIDPNGRSAVRSSVTIPTRGTAVDVDVAVLIEHTYVGDLALVLEAPSGAHVVLADRVRGSADDYDRTVFDDDAANWIRDASGSGFGQYRPTEALATLDGEPTEGDWTLHVIDLADGDGGRLLAWAMALDIATPADRGFEITVDFDGGLNARQREAFAGAAQRWMEIITEPLVEMWADSARTTTGVVISAKGIPIDGGSGTLGRAGPTRLRPTGTGLPYVGIMEFDLADLANMEADGSLGSVIVHEMGHVLGIGTLWAPLLDGRGGPDPRYRGPEGNARWQAAGGSGRVPIANTGGPGTRDGHWREQVLVDELMTGFLSGADQPLSAITIGCLDDLGYTVDYDRADAYVVPGPGIPALRGIDSSAGRVCRACALGGGYPEPIIGPPEDIV